MLSNTSQTPFDIQSQRYFSKPGTAPPQNRQVNRHITNFFSSFDLFWLAWKKLLSKQKKFLYSFFINLKFSKSNCSQVLQIRAFLLNSLNKKKGFKWFLTYYNLNFDKWINFYKKEHLINTSSLAYANEFHFFHAWIKTELLIEI